MNGNLTGRTLGHFQILEPLGAGGMGEVYRAHDLTLDRDVALKFIRPDLLGDPGMLHRFQGEARALAATEHPYIGTVHGFEEQDGHSFIVMALVGGRPLDDLLRAGPLPMEQAAILLPRIAEGLAAAHAQGVVHRDVKGANILVDANNTPRLVDFGLAMRAQDTRGLKDSESAVGTLAYMAPEVVRGEPADERSDQFSFGVVAYQCLTGQLPFRGAHFASVLHATLNDETPPFPESLPPESRMLEPVVRRCLEKDPSRRFPDMAAVALALRMQAGTVASLKPARPAKARRRWWPQAAVILALLGAIGLGLSRWSARRPGGGDLARTTRSVAVLDFENLTGDSSLDWMGRGVAELLSSALTRSEELDVFDAQRLANLPRPASGLSPLPGSLDPLKRAGIGRAVVGSVLRSGNRLVIQGRVIEVASGKVLHSSSVEGKVGGDLFEMAGGLVKGLQAPLEVDLIGLKTGDQWLREITTSSPEAFRLFLDGRKAFIASHWAEAAKKYEQALALDPSFVAARIDLTGCYWNLDDAASLQKSLEAAHQLRNKAARREALQLDLIDAVVTQDSERLIRAATELRGLYPENRFFTYLQGRGYFTAQRYDDCLKVLGPLAGQRYEWAWTYMLLAQSHARLGHGSDARRAFELGLDVTRGDPELRSAFAQFLTVQGEAPKALEQLELAAQSPLLPQTPSLEAAVRLALGDAFERAGKRDRAKDEFERCMRLAAPGSKDARAAAAGLERIVRQK